MFVLIGRTPSADSLRTRIALGIALPLLVALGALSALHYQRERHLITDQIAQAAGQLGSVLAGSLRHAMHSNNRAMLHTILADMGQLEAVQRVQIVNLDGWVSVDSAGQSQGTRLATDGPGCVECHIQPAESRPRAINLNGDNGLLRSAAPIPNGPECAACHVTDAQHLGVLLIDAPLELLTRHALDDLALDMALSLAATVAITLGIALALNRLIARRIETFDPALSQLAAGDFSARLPVDSPDEIGRLAAGVNAMAAQLARQADLQARRSELRQQAIVEERERIARELHDGLAQLLGYVNTKAIAARLFLQKGQVPPAEAILEQVAAAAQQAGDDVRESILGLRLSGQITAGLAPTLQTYTTEFGRLSQLPVELDLDPALERATLEPETEAQALRILQEALNNVRRHAAATRVQISVSLDAASVRLSILDDGRGFDPAVPNAANGQRPHFGLSVMRERAESVGGRLEIVSAPGAGARLHVYLPRRLPSGETP